MFPLSTTSPVPRYVMEQYKCLVAAMEETDRNEENLFQLKKPCMVRSYRGEFEVTKFSPLAVISKLIAEVEALQSHVKFQEEAALRRNTQAWAMKAELDHLKGFAIA